MVLALARQRQRLLGDAARLVQVAREKKRLTQPDDVP